MHWNSELLQIDGENNKVTGIKVVSHPDGNPMKKIAAAASPEAAGVTIEEFRCDGVFLAIGHIPNTGFLKKQLPCNDEGYILPRMHAGECATCDVYSISLEFSLPAMW